MGRGMQEAASSPSAMGLVAVNWQALPNFSVPRQGIQGSPGWDSKGSVDTPSCKTVSVQSYSVVLVY